jgi:hypothetical protein
MAEPAEPSPGAPAEPAEPSPGAPADLAEPSPRWAWAAAAALPLALITAVTAPLWLRLAVPMWDGMDFYFPAFSYLADSLREGRLPLWDPYSNGGEPFLADPQRGLLNPALLLPALLVGDVFRAFLLSWLLHWWWGALGAAWLARRLGASPAGAALAASAYALSGFWISHAEHLPYLWVAAWLPWILGLADEAVARRRADRALLAAAALGLCAAGGGYPMLVAFTGAAAALWLGLRHLAFAPAGPDRRAALRWTAGTLALMAVVLALAWSPVLVAFLEEATAVSSRLSTTTAEQALFGSPFNLRTASSLFFPYGAVHLAGQGVDLGADVSMANAYLGFATVPLAVTWAATAFRRERKGWLVAFALLMLLTSLGGVGGVRLLWHWLLPPLRHMRFNAPFRLYWLLAVALAAGAGLGLLRRDEAARRTFLAAALGWLAGALAALAGLAAWMGAEGRPLGAALPDLLLPALLAGPAVVGLAWLVRRHPTRLAVGAVALLTALDVAAAALVCRGTVWRPEEGVLATLDALRAARTEGDGPPPPRRPSGPAGAFNAHLLLGLPVLRSYTSFDDPELNGVLHRSRFAGVLCGPRRFWLAPGTEPEAPRAEALRALAATGPDEPAPAFVEAGAAVRAAPRLAPGTFGEVAVLRYRPEEIVLDVAVPAGGPALLTGVERWTPAWSVAVDGRAARPLRTNLFFRGVEVPPGVHRVVWRYAPAWWWPLVALSAATLAACLAGAAWLGWRARRRERGGPQAGPPG